MPGGNNIGGQAPGASTHGGRRWWGSGIGPFDSTPSNPPPIKPDGLFLTACPPARPTWLDTMTTTAISYIAYCFVERKIHHCSSKTVEETVVSV